MIRVLWSEGIVLLVCPTVSNVNYLTVMVTEGIYQWFPNFLAGDPKETLDICPGPKLVKTADLQAHNASLRAAL